MADLEELEDNLDEQYEPAQRSRGYGHIFGDDDEDEEQQQFEQEDNYLEEQPIEDNLEEDPAQEEPVDVGPAPVTDRRALLAQLAAKKAKEQVEEAPKKKSKKRKSGEGDQQDKKRRKSNKKEKVVSGDDASEDLLPEDASAEEEVGAPAAAQEDINSEDLVENEADREFIDDEGAEGDEEVEDEDAERERLANMDEAMEDDGEPENEVDRALAAHKRKKIKENTQSMMQDIVVFLGEMEAAAEADYERVAENQGIQLAKDANGKWREVARGPPATKKNVAAEKLKMCTKVEQFFSRTAYHQAIIAQGGLGTLKSWLEPYVDMSLPHAKVRNVVLKALQLMKLDTRLDEHKSQLKKSELGARVMLLHKLDKETPENKKLAKELVQEWSRHIFYDVEAEAAKKRQQEAELKQARVMALAQQKAQHDTPQAAARKARATRIHACIPQGSKLDFVHNPGSQVQVQESGGGVKASTSVMAKKLRQVQRNSKQKTARPMKVSVEGRNIVMFNQA